MVYIFSVEGNIGSGKSTLIRELEKNNYIFHAGTKIKNSKVYSNGGRVLNFVIRSEEFKDGRDKIFKLINQLNWKGGFFRKDIGYKVID